MQIFKGAVSDSPLKESAINKRIIALDFIRVVCALGIVIYHVSSYSLDDAPKLLYSYANGTLDRVYVGIFLLMSGFVPMTIPAVIKVILVAVVLCIIYAWCISTLSREIQNTGWFKKIDGFFLKSRKKSENKE